MIGTARAGLLAVSFLLATAAAVAAACADNRVGLRGPWGEAQFTVEVADDVFERSEGLMFRESMPRMSGMLFVYDRPQRVSFWMKNTLIPLDMIFADETGAVQKVHHKARPGDLTPIPGGDNIQFVLEINGGLARQLGIEPGSVMRHPAFDQSIAAWPC